MPADNSQAVINPHPAAEHQCGQGPNRIDQHMRLPGKALQLLHEPLINIRSRGKFERPFTRVLDLEKKAQARWMQQEQELVAKVEQTNEKLKALEAQKDASQKFVVSEEQEQEIQKFREEKQKINKKLKEVRRNLRSDIERLGRHVKFLNIFLMPIIVSILGIIYAVAKRNKAARSRNESK